MGTIFVWERFCLNRAAQRGLHSIGKAALLSHQKSFAYQTSLACSLLVAQKEKQEAKLHHILLDTLKLN